MDLADIDRYEHCPHPSQVNDKVSSVQKRFDNDAKFVEKEALMSNDSVTAEIIHG